MGKARSKSKSKRLSAVKLFVLATLCFAVSKLFSGRIEIADYAFAVIGFVLFGLCFWTYYKNRKR